MKTRNFFYEKSNFKEFVSNISYHDLLKMSESLNDEKFEKLFLRFSQDFLRQVVAHEVGHTLGLRHNFAASTLTNLSKENWKFDQNVSEEIMLFEKFCKSAGGKRTKAKGIVNAIVIINAGKILLALLW